MKQVTLQEEMRAIPSRMNCSDDNCYPMRIRSIYTPNEVLWMMKEFSAIDMKPMDWMEGVSSGRTFIPVFMVQPYGDCFNCLRGDFECSQEIANDWEAAKQWMDLSNSSVMRETVNLCVKRGGLMSYEC